MQLITQNYCQLESWRRMLATLSQAPLVPEQLGGLGHPGGGSEVVAGVKVIALTHFNIGITGMAILVLLS